MLINTVSIFRRLEKSTPRAVSLTIMAAASLPCLPPTALAQNSDQVAPVTVARKLQRNAAGEVKYVVHLDPLYADGFKEHAAKAGMVLADLKKVPPGRPELEKPETRYLSAMMARTLGKAPERVRSWSGTEFEIHLNPSEVERLQRTKGVIELAQYEADPGPFTLSTPPLVPPVVNTWAYGDYAIGDTIAGNEVQPWWKQFSTLGINDATSYYNTTNYIKVFDGHLLSPLPGALIADSNIREKTEWGRTPAISTNDWARFHATHVLGTLNAGANNLLARGVNSAHPVLYHGVFSAARPYLSHPG